MSKYLEKLKEGNGLFEEAQSKIVSLKSSHDNSTLTSKEMKYNPNEVIVQPIKYENPQYNEVKNTYEILKPITKQIMELPVQVKKKIKTAKTVYNKEIIVNNEEEINQILNGGEIFQEIPLPSKSTIQNLIKDSMALSKDSTSNDNKKFGTKSVNEIYNNNYDYKSIPQSYYYSNKSNINNQKKDKKEDIFEGQSNIEYKDKNFIETYFHDDDIPQPTVFEGNALEFSDVINKSKEEIIDKSIKSIKSLESDDSNKNFSHFYLKNLLENLPIENTVLLSKQPKINMSKVQKDNMLHKSNASESSNNSNNQIKYNKYPTNEKLYKSQALNCNNKINNNEINNKNILKTSMNNYYQKDNEIFISNEVPLPEMDINSNYGNKNKMNKIKPKMELNNKNKKINNKSSLSKSTFSIKSSGGSFMSVNSFNNNIEFKNK